MAYRPNSARYTFLHDLQAKKWMLHFQMVEKNIL